MLRIPCFAAAILLAMMQQQPAFRTGVDLVAVEVTVIDRDGAPIAGLTPADFEVSISGHARRVVKAEWLTYGAERITPTTATLAGDAPGPPVTRAPRRQYVIAIDEESFQPAAAIAAKTAAARFIDKLRPDDYVGVYAYPTGKANMALTQDHAAVKKVLDGVNALRHEPPGRFHMNAAEIVDIANGDKEVLRNVVERECESGCTARDVFTEANGLAGYLEMNVTRSVEGLRGLVRGLARLPGRKVLVLVSGGLVSSDRAGRRVSSVSTIRTLTHDAAAANLELFVLHLDWSFLESFAEINAPATSYYRNSDLAASGLEILAGVLGGDVTRVLGTSPDFAFNRVLSKTSAYYLLGVEPADDDRDGKPHPIKVKVKRRGADVMSRAEVTIPVK